MRTVLKLQQVLEVLYLLGNKLGALALPECQQELIFIYHTTAMVTGYIQVAKPIIRIIYCLGNHI